MVEVGAQPVDEHLAEGLAPPGEVGEHGGVDVADANADARGILIFDATARARLEAAGYGGGVWCPWEAKLL